MVKTVPEYETSQVKTHNGTCAGQNQGFKKKNLLKFLSHYCKCFQTESTGTSQIVPYIFDGKDFLLDYTHFC